MQTTQTSLSSMEYAHIQQIMYDMKNGVLALDKKGKVLYANPQMISFFENDHLIGESIHSLMYAAEQPQNDAFWDTVLDVIHGHEIHHQKKVKYISPSGVKYSFHVTSSYLSGNADGIVITISDETEYDLLLQKKHDATFVLIAILMLVCLTVLITELHVFLNGAFPHTWIARFTELSGLALMLVFMKHTSLTVKDFGLIPTNIKKELAEAFLVVSVMALALIGGKAFLLFSGSDLFPAGRPFFDFTAPPDFYYLTYVPVVFMQELLTKCGLQKSIMKILESKHTQLISVTATAIMFMALHVQHGLVYMIGAGILSAVLALLYARHNSLCGCCIVHYSFGILGLVLNWIK